MIVANYNTHICLYSLAIYVEFTMQDDLQSLLLTRDHLDWIVGNNYSISEGERRHLLHGKRDQVLELLYID